MHRAAKQAMPPDYEIFTISWCKHHYYQLVQITPIWYFVTTALLLQYYLITTDQYLSLHNITDSLISDYYLLLPCYYNTITTLLFSITTYEYPLLFYYYIWISITSCYYKLINTWLLPNIAVLLHYFYFITVSLLCYLLHLNIYYFILLQNHYYVVSTC